MKGDYVEIWTTSPGSLSVRVTASKQGRRVEQRAKTFNKARWIEVRELTRTGRPTGNSASVLLDAILSISEVRIEP